MRVGFAVIIMVLAPSVGAPGEEPQRRSKKLSQEVEVSLNVSSLAQHDVQVINVRAQTVNIARGR